MADICAEHDVKHKATEAAMRKTTKEQDAFDEWLDAVNEMEIHATMMMQEMWRKSPLPRELA